MSRLVSFDCESTGLNPYAGHRPFLFVLAERLANGEIDIKISDNIEDFRDVLENPEIIKLGHNILFDVAMAYFAGVEIKGQLYDTMLAAHIFNENLPKKSLEFCSATFLGKKKLGDTLETWFKANGITKQMRRETGLSYYDKVPKVIMWPYIKADGSLTLEVFEYLEPKLKDMNLWNLFIQECNLIPALFRMQKRGVAIDIPYFKALEEKLTVEKEQLEKQIFQLAGKHFDINSGLQLGTLLEGFGIKVPRTDKTRSKNSTEYNYNIDEAVLATLDHPLAYAVVKYRGVCKNLTTYVQNLLQNQTDGVIHCNLRQIGTTTGRFSCTNPNLQNQSGDSEENKDVSIRQGFITRPGFTNFYIDYSSMEYRVFAAYCKDEWLIHQLINGADIHQITADMVGITRKQAKTLNFMLIYGGGAGALAKKLNISVEQAGVFIRRYFERMPASKLFLESVKAVCRKRGYIFNPFGRRRRLKSDEVYKAPNALIQGACADIMKIAMYKCDQLLQGTKSSMLLSVHDELIFEIHNDEFYLVPELVYIMEDWKHIYKVPLPVEVEYTTTNWSECKPYIFERKVA